MRYRSLAGVAMLGLCASCVPPMATGAVSPILTTRPQTPALLAAADSAGARSGGLFLHAVPLYPAPAAGQGFAALGPDTAAAPFALGAQGAEDAGRARDCLTAAIYYEARSQSVDGQRAVAQVVLNRVRSPAFPGSVCGVVYQGSHLSTGCQFSFTCDGSMAYRRDPAAWERAGQVAAEALSGGVYAPVGTATFYHTTAISPWWAPSLTPVTTIGAHIFYRWPGALGLAAAFTRPYAGLEPIRDGGGANAVATMESVMRYTFDGTTIAVFRGNLGTPAGGAARPAERSERGVAVHATRTGAETASADAPAPAADTAATPEGSNGVTIHRGAPPAALARAARGDIS